MKVLITVCSPKRCDDPLKPQAIRARVLVTFVGEGRVHPAMMPAWM